MKCSTCGRSDLVGVYPGDLCAGCAEAAGRAKCTMDTEHKKACSRCGQSVWVAQVDMWGVQADTWDGVCAVCKTITNSVPRITLDTLDSGKRQDFPTGSRRDTREGKGRYDLLSPLALRRLALVMERGAAKYGDRNWEKGQPLSRYLDSAIRHVFAYLAGDRSEDHLAQAEWNLHAAIHTEEMVSRGGLPATLYDLPEYGKEDK